MQDDLRKLKKRTGRGDDSSDSESEDDERRRKRRQGPSYLDQELAKYSTNKGRAAKTKSGRRADDDDLLEQMSSFAGRVKKAAGVDEDEERSGDEKASVETGAEAEGEEPLEVDDDVGWMSHALKFDKENADQVRRAEDDYTVS
jgi:peptidyl-prolyl cis-trans isomerase SDCCAG10